jgi:hypothetical protein
MSIGVKAGGLTAPLAPVLRTDRIGLGRDTQIREAKAAAVAAQSAAKQRVASRFVESNRTRAVARKTDADLIRLRRAAQSLDINAGIHANPLWDMLLADEQTADTPAADGTADAGAVAVAAKWIGRGRGAAADLDDDDADGPGARPPLPSRHDIDRAAASSPPAAAAAAAPAAGVAPVRNGGGSGGGGDDGGDASVVASDPAAAVARLIAYVRSRHHYCFWCAIKFDGADDMQRNCPGPAEADHDSDSLAD